LEQDLERSLDVLVLNELAQIAEFAAGLLQQDPVRAPGILVDRHPDQVQEFRAAIPEPSLKGLSGLGGREVLTKEPRNPRGETQAGPDLSRVDKRRHYLMRMFVRSLPQKAYHPR